jgi:t-SNARE complex subunit (syntaxin)
MSDALLKSLQSQITELAKDVKNIEKTSGVQKQIDDLRKDVDRLEKALKDLLRGITATDDSTVKRKIDDSARTMDVPFRYPKR